MHCIAQGHSQFKRMLLLPRTGSHDPRLSASAVGKRPSWPATGLRPAIGAIQTPGQSVGVPTVRVAIVRIGHLDVLLDSGAKFSVIRRNIPPDAYSTLFSSNPSSLIGAAGTRIRVYGEIPLAIRYKSSVVDLPTVQVVEDLIFPIILGMDWIDKSRAFRHLFVERSWCSGHYE